MGVIVVVLGLLAYALFRPRRRESQVSEDRLVAIGGLVVPSIILMVMLGFTVRTFAQEPRDGEMNITVNAHQFWWEVYYPEQQFETANEVHIPIGTKVKLRLLSDDVIHSFWVPELSGKEDTVPGTETSLVLEADHPGVYRGQCAEYCGLQHANMLLLVIADEPADFAAWTAAQARPAETQNTRGQVLFERATCSGCHTIRGTTAVGDFGPDLTHVGSRQTLASGMLPNTPGHLAGWIKDAQSLKPGNAMPPVPSIEPEELRVLVSYLEDLK